jgi:hypothetical protein
MRSWARCVVLAVMAVQEVAAQAPPCIRLNAPWWQVGIIRTAQNSGERERLVAISNEAHTVERRVLRPDAGGYELRIDRTRLGLRDSLWRASVRFTSDGMVRDITGDTVGIAKSLSPLLMVPCARLTAGARVATDLPTIDTVRTRVQRSATIFTPAAPIISGDPIDTLGQILVPVLARRTVIDTTRSVLALMRPGKAVADTVRPWSFTRGEEFERWLVRKSDGLVVYHERTRVLAGRGWVPPHPEGDVVTIQTLRSAADRVVDSAQAAGVLAVPRRGEGLISMAQRDTAAMHYREWRGDTLILRQFRRTGWRDEFRTVWRDSSLQSALLIEPGTANQPVGPFLRRFRIGATTITDGGAKDSVQPLPRHPWAIAIDGFEDVMTQPLLRIPVDSQPHRFSLYALGVQKGNWLELNANVLLRGSLRVARLHNMEKRWVGSLVYTATGELLASIWSGGQGITKIPTAGSRLGALLAAHSGKIAKEDLSPTSMPD